MRSALALTAVTLLAGCATTKEAPPVEVAQVSEAPAEEAVIAPEAEAPSAPALQVFEGRDGAVLLRGHGAWQAGRHMTCMVLVADVLLCVPAGDPA